MDFCGKSSGLADFENTVDRGAAVIFGADSGLYLSYFGILGPKRNLDHRSFFSLGRNVTQFVQIISFSKEVVVIGTALCYSHQVSCLLYYWDKINSGIHMYQFTFKPLHFCFRMCLWFRIWTKILADRRIWRKKGTDRRICIPLFTPLQTSEPARRLVSSYLSTLFLHRWYMTPSTVNAYYSPSRNQIGTFSPQVDS